MRVLDITKRILEQCVGVINDRATAYDGPDTSFSTIARYWNVYLKTRQTHGRGIAELSPEDVAAMMMLLKLARHVTGGKWREDTFLDMANYAALMGGLAHPGENEFITPEQVATLARETAQRMTGGCRDQGFGSGPLTHYPGPNCTHEKKGSGL